MAKAGDFRGKVNAYIFQPVLLYKFGGHFPGGTIGLL